MSDLTPEEIALLEAEVPIGILMPDDATMRLIPVFHGVVETHVGSAAESVTTNNGIVFWFDVTTTDRQVNRMATLNLLAVSNFSARTVPLLRGPVLATGQLRRPALRLDSRTDPRLPAGVRAGVVGQLGDVPARQS